MFKNEITGTVMIAGLDPFVQHKEKNTKKAVFVMVFDVTQRNVSIINI